MRETDPYKGLDPEFSVNNRIKMPAPGDNRSQPRKIAHKDRAQPSALLFYFILQKGGRNEENMTLDTLFTTLGITSGVGFIVVLMGLIKVKPLEISVWSWLARRLGKAFNGETNDRLEAIEKTLTEHMDADAEKEALHNRTMILRFADEMYEEKYHSRDHFEEIMERIDKYEAYCNEHPGFKNGRTASSEKLIKDQYEECLQRRSFDLKHRRKEA